MARARDPGTTRARILAAARNRFGNDGYERTTLRKVAADVGVDPAMVIRYFGSKEELFTAAADLTLNLPDLTGARGADLAAALIPRFLEVWEQDGTFLALLRAAMSSPTAAARMREIFAAQVAPTAAAVAPDHPQERAALLGAFIIGMATSRCVLETPGLPEMSQQDLVRWAGPVIEQILTGPS